MNVLSEFKSGLSYQEYIEILGQNLSLHQLHERKITVPDALKKEIAGYEEIKVLVLTEPWCGDSLALVPIISRIAECNPSWQMRIIRRDENPELMEKFLTKGGKAVPIFLFLNPKGEFLFRWGPRPQAAQQIFEDHRERIFRGEIEKIEVMKKIRVFYAKDRGMSSLAELMDNFRHHEF